MFDTIKLYIGIIVTAVIAGFIAMFKYRGMQIEALEKEVESHEAKDKKQDFEADNRVAAAKAEAEDVKDIEDGKVIL